MSHAKPRARKLGDRVDRSLEQLQQSHTGPLGIFSPGKSEPRDDQLDGLFDPGRCREMYLALVDNRLTLADFRPLEAPFVPEVIKMLVNSIEADCYASDWEPIFSTHQNLNEMSDMHACVLLQNWNHQNHLKCQIKTLSLPMKIAVLRSILSGFKLKPLHFSRRLLIDVIKRPLFDQFLRPNPNMKSIVKRAVLPCNRTTMDTLSFIMLHLLHAWEYASNPLTAKLRLSKIYGPLLVSFAERPVILDQDPTDYKTEEGAILEVVLEECNGQFWDNMGMSQLRRAFTGRTTLEKAAIEKGKLSLIATDVDSDNEKEAWFTYLLRKQKKIDKEGAKRGGKGKKLSKEAKM
ncbi:unnamed protein product [Schistocephalus solidus]|uniref:Similar to n=1 Tax=Schistocephalus solidus TaxID=70667 RepID=A0A183SXH9_SCHSO|nr:unnamed protein product [Schistocephalus solidus]